MDSVSKFMIWFISVFIFVIFFVVFPAMRMNKMNDRLIRVLEHQNEIIKELVINKDSI